jgi:hypothetical protein
VNNDKHVADPWPALEAMARQCIAEDWDKPAPGYYRNMNIARFAALVRADALEQAAKVPEAAAASLLAQKRAPQVDRHCAYVLEVQSAAIRALKEAP